MDEANEKERPPEFEINIDLRNVDLRPIHALQRISALRKYVEVMEQQMGIASATEPAALEAERPDGLDEEDHSIYSGMVSSLECLYEEDLFPTMRYSFVVFIFTTFETNIHYISSRVRRDKDIPISLSDLGGRLLEQSKKYFSRFLGIQVSGYPEWVDLTDFQAIRNCIVHRYGYLDPNDARLAKIQKISEKAGDVSVASNRVLLSEGFCSRHLNGIESFFRRLMEELGWKV